MDDPASEPEPVDLPIDGVLDLHTFRPRDVTALVGDYLDGCRERGICEVRIIHGKGRGVLRRTVHAVLARRSDVVSYRLAGDATGGWGATVVILSPPEGARQEPLAGSPPPREEPEAGAPRQRRGPRDSVMSPRERVLAALRHEQPDRTPRDFWAEPPALARLFAHVGHCDKESLLESLSIDIRHLDAPEPPERSAGGGILQNLWGERFIYRSTPWGPVREDVRGALAGATRFSELERFDWPRSDCIDRSCLVEQCRRLEPFALLYGFADVWQRPALVRGWDQMFVDMARRPEWVHFLCRTFTDFYLADYTRAAEITGGRIDLYLLISDLGSQRGPLISTPMFCEFVAPYLRQMIDRIHELGGSVLFHSCGAVASFIPELVGLGVDVLDPVQPVGPEMAPESLKAKFGDRLSFHGGIDMQGLLPRGGPAEVESEARRYCEILGAGGGYILAPAHLFQPDVPPENILAMYGAGCV